MSLPRVLVLGVCLAVALSAGCATTLVYNHADWLLTRQLDGYVDLTRSQRAFVSTRLNQILAHHRREALPRYEDAVAQVRARIQRGLTGEDVEWAFAQCDQLKTDLLARFVPDGAEFARLVEDRQIARLRGTLAKRLANQEQLLQETAETRTARLLDLAREWLGSLTRQQQEELTRLAMELPDTLPALYEHQRRRHERLVAILHDRAMGDTAARLYDWLVTPEKGAEPRFLDAMRHMKQHQARVILALDRLATPDQRRHVLAKLEELADTIHRLRAT